MRNEEVLERSTVEKPVETASEGCFGERSSVQIRPAPPSKLWCGMVLDMVRKVFRMRLSDIQPSQLYICSEKLSEVLKTFNRDDPKLMEPIPVKKLGDDIILLMSVLEKI
jgi:hypothetical protein